LLQGTSFPKVFWATAAALRQAAVMLQRSSNCSSAELWATAALHCKEKLVLFKRQLQLCTCKLQMGPPSLPHPKG